MSDKHRISIILISVTMMMMASSFSSPEVRRSKRNLPLVFPDGGVYKLLLGWGIPVKNPANISLAFAFNFQYQYQVPPNITFFSQYFQYAEVARKKRDLVAMESYQQRLIFYEGVERAMDNFGINGGECLRRTICEAAENPINHGNGMIGDLFHVLFTPDKHKDVETNQVELENYDDYYDAMRAGEMNYDCRKLYPLCPMGHGLFDIISILE